MQVVTITDQRGPAGTRVPRGAVGVVLKAPTDAAHDYWVRLVDGVDLACKRHELATLARWQDADLGRGPQLGGRSLFDRVIIRVAIGSRDHGLTGRADRARIVRHANPRKCRPST